MKAMDFQVDLLIELLNGIQSSKGKAYALELFVQTYGPIPNNRADDVRYALDGFVDVNKRKEER